jgi:DNA polymerase III epsilon subunit-like protein
MIRLADARFLVLDLETTGLNSDVDRVVELAWVQVNHGCVRGWGSTLVDPLENIPTAASQKHGITDDMVKDAPTLQAALIQVETILPHVDALVAHNARFDLGFLPRFSKPVVCTLAWSRKVWPEKSHRLQRLADELGLRDMLPMIHRQPHRALPDAMLTGFLLCELIAQSEPEKTITELFRELEVL